MIYKAFVVEESDGKFISSIKNLNTDNLPAGDVLIRVYYSSLNYKDALSATGNKGVTKKYPHTPGIDAVGIVVHSDSEHYKAGDEVIVTGYDLGMNTPGGFGEYIRVPEDWVINLPSGLSMKEAMIIGTAGFTAGISMLRLTALVRPEDGKIIVSGATGGVGSMALSMLSKAGYTTVAISGKTQEHDFLKSLGVKEIIQRTDFQETENKPILSSQYAGAIDTVGGDILVRIIKSLNPLGVVTTCGSVAGTKLDLNVFPFILRGVSLIGVSAQNYPVKLRKILWEKLAKEMKPDNLMNLYEEVTLDELSDSINLILSGKLKGRTIVRVAE
ncbi:MAG: YhdH/YhfP family quinone oxidoreductase [Paludibacter sp.]|nr:YhdH/YhfP family quinone oxidoreductase [Paludibacter sp.]